MGCGARKSQIHRSPDRSSGVCLLGPEEGQGRVDAVDLAEPSLGLGSP